MIESLFKKIATKTIKFKFNIDKPKAAYMSSNNPQHKYGIPHFQNS